MLGIEGQLFNNEQKEIKADLIAYMLEKFIWRVNKVKDKFSPQEQFDLINTVLITFTSEVVLEMVSRFVPKESYNDYLDFLNATIKNRTKDHSENRKLN